MTRSLHAVACAAALWCLAVTATQAESLYDRGRAAWSAGDYPGALTALLTFRQEPYGRRPDVDYMLGTSGCRVAERVTWGRDVLDWMLYAYALTYQSRVHVSRERDRCRDVELARLDGDLTQIVEERAAGMTGFGKTFYWAAREEQPVASYPIRRKREMAKEELLARRIPVGEEAAAVALARSLSPDGRALVHEHFLLVSEAGHEPSDLRAIGRTLNRYIGFLEASYGMVPPAHYLAVYLVKSHYDVSEMAERMHGLDVSRATVGYAFVDDASVVAAVPEQAAGTVLHELFHLLVRERFGDVPQWLDEGMAALYEVSGRNGDRYFGLPNWRGRVLDELWDVRPDIGTLIRTEWFLFDDPEQARSLGEDGQPANIFLSVLEGKRQAATMATARYFALYLEQRGELAPVFKAMRDQGFSTLEGDARDHAVGLVEATLGRDAATLDAEFADWFLSGQAQRPRDGLTPVAYGAPLYDATADVNVRTGPSTAYSKITLLRRGTQVAVFDEQDGWYELRLADGTVAFVSADYLAQSGKPE